MKTEIILRWCIALAVVVTLCTSPGFAATDDAETIGLWHMDSIIDVNGFDAVPDDDSSGLRRDPNLDPNIMMPNPMILGLPDTNDPVRKPVLVSPGYDGTGYCLDFNRVDIDQTEAVDAFGITAFKYDNFHIDLWFQPDVEQLADNTNAVLMAALQPQLAWQLALFGPATARMFFVPITGGNGWVDVPIYGDGRWEHLTAGIHRNGVVYLNTDLGSGTGYCPGNRTRDAGGLDITLGSRYNTQAFDGRIDEVKLWSYFTDDELIERGWAGYPDPARDATVYLSMTDNLVLSWSPAVGADSHDIYFGTDYETVSTATTRDANTVSPTHTVSSWSAGIDYYWRIDEVNDGNIMAPGKVWSFKVSGFTLDNFDSYGSDANLYAVWEDYRTYLPNGGAIVAITSDPVISGDAMRFDYYNGSFPLKLSEIKRDYVQNLTVKGIEALEINFRGTVGNDANETLYVVLDDGTKAAAVEYGTPADLESEEWTEWIIDLDLFVAANDVNLASIQKIMIGFGDRANPQVGGDGTVFFDNFHWLPSGCYEGHKPATDVTGDCKHDNSDIAIMNRDWLESDYNVVTVAPNSAGLKGWWEFEDVNLYDVNTIVDSSGNGNNATEIWGTPSIVPGYIGDGLKPELSSGIKINGFNVSAGTGQFTMACWAKWYGLATPTDTKQALISKRQGHSIPGMNWTWYVDARGIQLHSPVLYLVATLEPLPTDEWKHMVVMFDGNDATFYVDGRHLHTGKFIEGQAPDVPFIIGCTQPGAPQRWNGVIDDVRAYNYCLSEAEVAYLYSLGAPSVYFTLGDREANLYEDEVINFKDYAKLGGAWLTEDLWP